jgi:hypothetical protein
MVLPATLPTPQTINTRPEDTVNVGDLFYIYNGSLKVLQRVTSPPDVANHTYTFAAADSMNINQPGAASGSVAPLLNKTDNKAQRLRMVTYYIDNSGAVPMLMRQDNLQTATAVALGITNFQVAYNATTWSGGTPNIPTTNITNTIFPTYTINQVDQAQIALVARSDRVLRMSNRFVSNDMITQIGFRSISAKQDYSVLP